MAYQVIVPKRVQHESDNLPAPERSRVVHALERLRDEPRPPGCVKLKSSRFEYRIHVGDYRVRYDVRDTDQTVSILRVQHRSDVYRP